MVCDEIYNKRESVYYRRIKHRKVGTHTLRSVVGW